jgi:hypothetical protein
MVYRCKLVSVMRRKSLMCHLPGSRLKMTLPHSGKLCAPWPCINAAWPVKAGAAIAIVIVDHRTVKIGIMHKSAVYTPYGSIILEPSAKPASASKSIATVSKTVINTAIETYGRTPVAYVKAVKAAFETPIWRCP